VDIGDDQFKITGCRNGDEIESYNSRNIRT